MTDDEKSSPGKLFVDAFIDKNLVKFDECRTHYRGMTPDQLVDELGFLLSKPVMSIPFAFSGNRYYAFFSSLVECTANSRDLTRDQRTRLVNMAIDVRSYLRGRTTEDKRQKLDDALSCNLEVSLLKNMFGLGSGRPTMASGNSLSGE